MSAKSRITDKRRLDFWLELCLLRDDGPPHFCNRQEIDNGIRAAEVEQQLARKRPHGKSRRK